MLSHFVNTLTFDFTCNSEAVAKSVQREFRNYTAFDVNNVIQRVLAGYVDDKLIKIDRLEINLGDVEMDDLSSAAVIKNLEDCFEEKLNSAVHQIDNKDKSANSVTAQLAILQQFLLFGDLPWWINKLQLKPLDRILQNLINANPEEVKQLVYSILNQQEAIGRLHNQFSKASKASISKLLADDGIGADLIDILQHPIKTTIPLPVNIIRDLELLMSENKAGLLKVVLSPKVQMMLARLREKSVSPKVQKLLIQYFKTKNPDIFKVEAFIVKAKLFINNTSGTHQNIGILNDLQLITKLLIRQVKQYHSALINELQQQLSLHRYNMLQLPSMLLKQHTPEFDQKLINRLKDFDTQLRDLEKSLSRRQTVIITDKPVYNNFLTTNEQKLMGSILKKLSLQNIATIHNLTQLTKDQLTQLNNASLSNQTHGNIQNKIIVENAGLCLIASFLPALFHQLEYLEEDKFKDRYCQIRGLYLLQYIANGKANAPEYLLPLNKVLCGFDSSENIAAKIRLTNKEKDEVNDLLSSVIAHWQMLGTTSVDGFRSSFLQRKGLLFFTDNTWTLQVEKKGYDMLLNSIPWSFNLVKLSWMKNRLQTEW